MCLAIPACVVEIEGENARVDILGNSRFVKLALVEGVSVGDYVLVHAGFAIERLEPEDAEETLSIFREMGEALREEK